MQNTTNNLNFKAKFCYYYENKRTTPYYIHKIAKEFLELSNSNPNMTLLYNGHKKSNFSFALLNNIGEKIKQKKYTKPQNFLDNRYKFVPHIIRQERLSNTAKELFEIFTDLLKNP